MSGTAQNYNITEDDELWIVQTPAELETSSLENTSLDFESSISHMKCRVNGKRKRYNVYTSSTSSRNINLLLPSEGTKSYISKLYPLAGKLILQETLRAVSKKENLPSEIQCIGNINKSVVDLTSEPEIEVVDNCKKKKKKKH